MNRRQFLRLAASATTACASPAALAEGSGVLRIIVPFTPGGPQDVTTRLLAPAIALKLGRSAVIDNRPGAAGLIGTRTLQSAPNNGDITILMTYVGFVGLPYLQKAATYNPLKDFTPIAGVANAPGYIYINGAVPAHNIAEFIAWAKTKPEGVESATSGPGGGSHLWTLLLSKRAGINLVPVPYKGTSEMTTALVRGDCKIIITGPSEALNAQVAAGTLRILGVTSAAPSPLSPDVPVVADTVPGFVIDGWLGFIGQGGLSAADVDAISAAAKMSLLEPGVREKFAAMYTIPEYLSPSEFRAAMVKTDEFYKRLVSDIGVMPL